jgi:hypothetical protein
MAWSQSINFYAFSCSSLWKTVWNLIETAHRKSQLIEIQTLTTESGLSRWTPILPPVSPPTGRYVLKALALGWINVA